MLHGHSKRLIVPRTIAATRMKDVAKTEVMDLGQIKRHASRYKELQWSLAQMNDST